MRTTYRNDLKSLVSRIPFLLFLAALGGTLIGFEPASAFANTGSAPVVVSMGDSYSSGEGNPHFYGYAPNDQGNQLSDERFQSEDWLAHRSLIAWPGKLTVRGQKLKSLKYNPVTHVGSWYFVAASGALTYHILGDGEVCALHGVNDGCQPKPYDGAAEIPRLPCQMDVFGIITEPVDYVTLTIGGNDVGFTDVVSNSVLSVSDITGPVSFLESFRGHPLRGAIINSAGLRIGSTQAVLNNAIDTFEKTTKKRLHDTYEAIIGRAGNQATLIVAGYPRLFTENPHAKQSGFLSSATSLLISSNEAQMVNRAVDYFDNSIEAEASSLQRVRYAEIRQFTDVNGTVRGFNGHGAYGPDSYINEICSPQEEDLKRQWFDISSAYSMHPNAKGQEEYAAAVQVQIDAAEQIKNGVPTSTDLLSQNATVPPTVEIPTEVNISVVMDVSGSMGDSSAAGTSTKLESAQQQSEAFVLNAVKNSGQGDNGGLSTRVGIAIFSESSQVACGLSNNPDDISGAIESLSPRSATNIYAGLSEGIAQLENEEGVKIMMFLSDGLSNRGPGESDILDLAAQARDKGIVIYTIGYGPSSDLDESLLKAIADTTGGGYSHEDSSSVASASVGLFAAMMDAQLQQTSQLLHSSTGTVGQGATTQAGSFEVNSAGTIKAYLYWPGSALDLQLTDPNGTVVGDGYTGYSADLSTIPAAITIQNAKPGTWNMSVYGRETSMAEEPFYAAASFTETQQPQSMATGGGGGGAHDNGAILLLLLSVVAIGSILGLYAMTAKRDR